MNGDVERLAEVICLWSEPEGPQPGESFPCDGCTDLARAVLASNWLAERDQKTQAAGAALNVIAHGPRHPDMETYARIHNEGWDAAMLAQVAPDPTTADDWLAAHDAEVAERALREAADEWFEEQGAEYDGLSPMEYVKANGFIDFPHAWMIARRTAPEYHHNECSFNATGGALLCDCEVLTESPEYVLSSRIAERLASAQHVTEWLRAGADRVAGHEEGDQ